MKAHRNALPVYQQAIDEAAKVTGTALMPWDTQLDPTTNTKLVQEQVLLVQGDVGVNEFIQTMDAALAENAPADTVINYDDKVLFICLLSDLIELEKILKKTTDRKSVV